MKDIDFDELDRAVSSLMNSVPRTEPEKEEDIKTVALGPDAATPVNEAKPAESTPEVKPETDNTPSGAGVPATSQTPASSNTLPSSRRRGRFMDVVRPPAPEPPQTMPARRVSRVGASIEPPARTPSPASVMNVDSAPRESGSATQEPAKEPAAPLVSPFLPDAKVEKRPLGGFAETNTDPISSLGPDGEPDNSPDMNGVYDAPDGDMAVPVQPLPAELGKDVMAIEADPGNIPVRQSEPAVQKEAGAPAPFVPPAPTTSSVSVPFSPPAVTSIPQQYKIMQNTAELAPVAIYDTAAYHQPLAHPAKKKPGWLWVIAIILILLLGAACGAAVYFFGLM